VNPTNSATQPNKLVPLSKFLSLVLRHKPETIGIKLDAGGWVEVAELLAACQRHGKQISMQQLMLTVETNDRQRFALSEDKARIRANQGHSIDVELGHHERVPPEILFHGTASRFVDSKKANGLIKDTRHHVHLTTSDQAARARPCVLCQRQWSLADGSCSGWLHFLRGLTPRMQLIRLMRLTRWERRCDKWHQLDPRRQSPNARQEVFELVHFLLLRFEQIAVLNRFKIRQHFRTIVHKVGGKDKNILWQEPKRPEPQADKVPDQQADKSPDQPADKNPDQQPAEASK
jgi:putative RNA 2'-phosphotransferase